MNCIAIVPAAGLSRRMGEPKLLKHFDGAPLINHVLNAWLASGVQRVVVVVREENTDLREHLLQFDVDIATADPPPEQMKDNIS